MLGVSDEEKLSRTKETDVGAKMPILVKCTTSWNLDALATTVASGLFLNCYFPPLIAKIKRRSFPVDSGQTPDTFFLRVVEESRLNSFINYTELPEQTSICVFMPDSFLSEAAWCSEAVAAGHGIPGRMCKLLVLACHVGVGGTISGVLTTSLVLLASGPVVHAYL